jgi:DNA-directed RNA polymerase specialized sigma24 family protein
LDREESTGVSKHLVQDKLLNWALWCEWGLIGPPVQTRAASAEGDYNPELGEIYDPPEPVIEPDFKDGERMEQLIRELPELQRRIVKAKYVSFPYQKHFSVAQKLRISQDRFELELRLATERLARKWNKGLPNGTQSASAS